MKSFHPLMIISRLVKTIIPSATAIFVLVAVIASVRGTIRILCIGILIYYILTRIYFLFYDWATTRYAISPHGLTLTTGVFNKRTKVIQWKDIRSAATVTDPILRSKDLQQIELMQYTNDEQKIVLFAIPRSEALTIKSFLHNQSPAAQSTEKDDAMESHTASRKRTSATERTSTIATSLLPHLSIKDYFLIGFTYAQFLVIIPTIYAIIRVIFLHQEYSDDSVEEALSFFALTPATKVGIAILVIALGLAYGTISSWVQFSNITVVRTTDGYDYSAGIINPRTQFIPMNRIESVTVSQNLLMRLVHRYQLTVSTGGFGTSRKEYSLIPLGDLKTIASFLDAFFPDKRESSLCMEQIKSAKKKTLLSTALLIIIGICTYLLSLQNFSRIYIEIIALALLIFIMLNCISHSYYLSNTGLSIVSTGFFNLKYRIFKPSGFIV